MPPKRVRISNELLATASRRVPQRPPNGSADATNVTRHVAANRTNAVERRRAARPPVATSTAIGAILSSAPADDARPMQIVAVARHSNASHVGTSDDGDCAVARCVITAVQLIATQRAGARVAPQAGADPPRCCWVPCDKDLLSTASDLLGSRSVAVADVIKCATLFPTLIIRGSASEGPSLDSVSTKHLLTRSSIEWASHRVVPGSAHRGEGHDGVAHTWIGVAPGAVPSVAAIGLAKKTPPVVAPSGHIEHESRGAASKWSSQTESKITTKRARSPSGVLAGDDDVFTAAVPSDLAPFLDHVKAIDVGLHVRTVALHSTDGHVASTRAALEHDELRSSFDRARMVFGRSRTVVGIGELLRELDGDSAHDGAAQGSGVGEAAASVRRHRAVGRLLLLTSAPNTGMALRLRPLSAMGLGTEAEVLEALRHRSALPLDTGVSAKLAANGSARAPRDNLSLDELLGSVIGTVTFDANQSRREAL